MKEELLWQQMQTFKNIPPPPQTQRQESFPPSKIPRPKLIPPLHVTDSQPQMKGKLLDSRPYVTKQSSAPSMVFNCSNNMHKDILHSLNGESKFVYMDNPNDSTIVRQSSAPTTPVMSKRAPLPQYVYFV